MAGTDVHTHLAPVLEGEGGLMPALYDAGALVRHLAFNGLDRAWVSAPPPFYRQHLGVEETRTWVRALDDGMRARIAGEPALDRLTYLPFDQPGIAFELVEDITDAVGWTASAGGGSLPLDDPAFERLWALLAARGKPLLLHPGESPDARLERHYLANLLGNPVETGVAAAQLVLGGVLTRHPGLVIILVHGGGVVPSVVARWARGVATARPGIAPGVEDPLLAVRRLWSDCLAHRPELVDLAITTFGADHLLLGSDYPFPMGLDNPFDALAHLEPDVRARIAGNARAASRA